MEYLPEAKWDDGKEKLLDIDRTYNLYLT